MKNLFITLALSLLASSASLAQNISGAWNGTLNTGMGELRLVLHITKNADGTLKAMLDSLDQNANGIPVTSITRSGRSLKFEMNAIGGSYEGTISTDLGGFTGTWTQLGKSFPLAFKRVKNTAHL